MKGPFFSVFLDNSEKKDITEWIEYFRYERSVSEDDMLEITIASQYTSTLDQTEDVKTGMVLVFQYGYKAGAISRFHRAKIRDIDYRYAERVVIKLRCLDQGTTMRKTTSGKVWKNVTTGDVVKAIAAKHDLKAVIEAPGRKWKSYAQGNMSDMEFVQHLSQQDNSGNFIVYVTEDELRMESLGTAKDSSLLLTYGEPESGWVSFEPKKRESTIKGDATKSTVHGGLDPHTKTEKVATAASGAEKNPGTDLGDYRMVYDENGTFLRREKFGEASNSSQASSEFVQPSKTIVAPGSMETGAMEDQANDMKKKGHQKASYGTLTISGNPQLNLNGTITLAGLFERHNGNYLIKGITDTISSGKYTTTIQVHKNASKHPTTDKSSRVNKTVGDEQGKANEVKVFRYDANGNEIK